MNLPEPTQQAVRGQIVDGFVVMDIAGTIIRTSPEDAMKLGQAFMQLAAAAGAPAGAYLVIPKEDD